MKEYHKIQTLFKRDMENGAKLIPGDWTTPELDFLQNNAWVFTEKVDGTNIRIMYDGQDIVFGGKTDDAQIPAFLVQRLDTLFKTITQREKFKEIFPDGTACLYGEGYGAKIQKGGGNYKSTQDFVLFDVKVGDWWLQRTDVEDVAQKLGIDVVPIIGEGTLNEAIEIAKTGFNSQWGAFAAEGIVARPKTELKSRNGHRIITKIKHRDFR